MDFSLHFCRHLTRDLCMAPHGQGGEEMWDVSLEGDQRSETRSGPEWLWWDWARGWGWIEVLGRRRVRRLGGTGG